MKKITETRSHQLGYSDGVRRGDAITDCNCQCPLGFCQIMDLCPNPLSGEWAGESISEIFNLNIGEDYPDDEVLTAYEQGFQEGFWNKAIKNCNYHLGGTE